MVGEARQVALSGTMPRLITDRDTHVDIVDGRTLRESLLSYIYWGMKAAGSLGYAVSMARAIHASAAAARKHSEPGEGTRHLLILHILNYLDS